MAFASVPGHEAGHARSGGALQLVIFDCDGVLVDSEPLASRSYAEMLTAAGFPMTQEEAWHEFTGLPLGDVRVAIERRTGRRLPEDFEARHLANLAHLFETELRPFDGVLDALDLLDAAGMPYCCASNSGPSRIQSALVPAGLHDRFDGRVFSGELVPRPKPAPDLLLAAAASIGAAPGRCLLIDDTPVGIAAARAAGMRVWAPATTYPPARLADADSVPATMLDVAAMLRRELASEARP